MLLISVTWSQQEDWDTDIVETSLLAFKVEIFSDGYVIPWGMSFLPDGDLIVSDICGKIFRVNHRGHKKMLVDMPWPVANPQYLLDETATVAVQVKFKEMLKKPVTLENIKKDRSLSQLPMIKQSRLSVCL